MLKIDSISFLCELLGCGKPKHPLITVIDFSSIQTLKGFQNTEYVQNYYVISLKNGADCEMKYGRHHYDFTEGSLVFTAPGQVLAAGDYKGESNEGRNEGWMLCVHPDLIKGTSLWRKMPDYGFFEYKAYEALHLPKLNAAIRRWLAVFCKDAKSKRKSARPITLLIVT